MVKESIIIKNLSVSFPLTDGFVYAVDGIDAEFQEGCFTAIIGESGCGKSVLGQAILGMLPQYASVQGKVLYGETDLLKDAKVFYGKGIGLVAQNPAEALHQGRKIKKQFDDILNAHNVIDRDDNIKRHWLEFFALKDVDRVLQAYPFELSGGMQQRVLCAMSICLKPRWILADEPTKGIDEENCQVVFENLLRIKGLGQMGMILITHDIELAKQVGDIIAVMYGGQIVEMGRDVLTRPLHPYTQGFLAALPEHGFQSIPGKAPIPGEKIRGCKFAARCPKCSLRCLQEVPSVYQVGDCRVRCFAYA